MSQTTTSHLEVSLGPPRPESSVTISSTATSPSGTTTSWSRTTTLISTTSPSSTTTATSGTSGAITLTGIASASLPHISLEPIPVTSTSTTSSSTSTSATSAGNLGAVHNPRIFSGLPGIVLAMWIGFFTYNVFRPSRR